MLLPDIDEKATQKKVNTLLDSYSRLERLANQPVEQKLTQVLSFEPKSYTGNGGSPIENRVAMKVEAEMTLKEINNAMQVLSPESQRRLKDHYIFNKRSYNPTKILYDKNFESSDTYYRKLNRAKIEFAEAYGSGELLCFNT